MEQCELCDLIFIISIVFGGKKYFEKITFNQFKKENKRTKSVSWDLSNKEQLYLLSRFPVFNGIKGSLIPQKKYTLPNYSNCLGSYGLLFKPGDFAFVSGPLLDSVIGNKKTLNKNEFSYFINNPMKNQFDLFPFSCFYPFGVMEILGNRQFSNNVFDFVKNFLRSNIGEPSFMEHGLDNPQALLFLQDLMSELARKANGDKNKRLTNFVNSFQRFPYTAGKFINLANEGENYMKGDGGLGIIHTTINLGE